MKLVAVVLIALLATVAWGQYQLVEAPTEVVCPKCSTNAVMVSQDIHSTEKIDTVWNTITRCSADSFEMKPTGIMYATYPERQQLACPFGHVDFSYAVEFPVSKRLETNITNTIIATHYRCPKCKYAWTAKPSPGRK